MQQRIVLYVDLVRVHVTSVKTLDSEPARLIGDSQKEVNSSQCNAKFGRQLETVGNNSPREMIIPVCQATGILSDRIRLIVFQAPENCLGDSLHISKLFFLMSH